MTVTDLGSLSGLGGHFDEELVVVVGVIWVVSGRFGGDGMKFCVNE